MPPIGCKDIPQIPESTYASDLAKIVKSVEQTVKASYEKEKQSRAVRFAHAKAYGVVRASVEIESVLPPEYAQGIYIEHDYIFELKAQLCVDPLRMPIENTSIEWSERLSPFTKIATIHIPKQDISSPVNLEIADRISITPWRTREDHIPLGEIMTVRRDVYRRSAELRRQINQQPQKEPSSSNEVFDQHGA